MYTPGQWENKGVGEPRKLTPALSRVFGCLKRNREVFDISLRFPLFHSHLSLAYIESSSPSYILQRTFCCSFLSQVKTGCCGLDPTTGRGKQIHLAQMLLLPFVPIMALIIQNGLNMVNVLQYQYEMQETIDQVQISTGLGNVTEALQSERAEIAFYLFTNGSVIRRNLSEHFAYTNSLIDNLKWPKFRIEDPLFKNKILFRIRLDDFRDKITKFDTPSIDAGIKFYNRANYIFLDQLTREIKEKDSSGVWRPLLAYKNLIRAIEHLGISMVFGEEYFGRGDLDHTSYLNFVTNDALGQDFLNASKSFAYWIKDRYLQLQQTYPWYSNITRRRQEIINRVKIEPDFDKATEYFYAMLGYLDALQKIQYEIRTRIEETILSEVWMTMCGYKLMRLKIADMGDSAWMKWISCGYYYAYDLALCGLCGLPTKTTTRVPGFACLPDRRADEDAPGEPPQREAGQPAHQRRVMHEQGVYALTSGNLSRAVSV
nr:uncharacterized protein LOC113806499 [Penaeus vannamei]